MTNFNVHRLLTALFVLWVVSVLIFIGCEILPGDVAQAFLGQYATEENLAALRNELGLNEPALFRYLSWLGGTVTGDWGMSLTSRVPVSQLLDERLTNTMILAGSAALVSVPLALGLGLMMSYFAGRTADHASSIVVLCLASLPEFLVATLAVLFFAVNLRWLPAIAYLTPGSDLMQTARSLVLPVGTLTIILTAQIARMTRATINNIMHTPFVEMAKLKGVSRGRIIATHALSNAVGPLANIIALNLAYLVSGIVIVEAIFSFPGLATLMIDAVKSRDLPVIQACALIFSAAYVLLILAADILAIVFNPRARDGQIPGAAN